MTQPFQLESTPLHPGPILIEASAGTGKTFAIAGLFLRLVVEQQLPVEKILVVTYTEAATEELRDRIRRRLTQARQAFAARDSGGDPLLDALFRRCRSPGAAEETRQLLDIAVGDLDRGAIYTIHGFCQRVLRERAFESGSLFDLELITEPSALLRRVAEDYWRETGQRLAPTPLWFALKNRFSPTVLVTLLENTLRYPDLHWVSRAADRTLAETSRDLEEAFAQARAEWTRHEARICAAFGDGQTWANRPYNSSEQMAAMFDHLKQCFSVEPSPRSLDVLAKFAASVLKDRRSQRAGAPPCPQEPFFDCCERLLAAERLFVPALKLDFLRQARGRLETLKEQQKLQTFDDLLMRLREALRGPRGEALAAQMRGDWPAALIDEFQDTDPVQWEIFRRVFADGSHPLFLIGDPKQAIYGFRGADIFTYLEAAEGVAKGQRFSLTHNWRSEAGLVHAVNRVFSGHPRPFVFEEIAVPAVEARGEADRSPLRFSEGRKPPLVVWFHPRDKGARSVGRTAARDRICAALADEIVRLLGGEVRLGDQPLRPEHLAVLVERHHEAREVQAALEQRQVPAVLYATASLFDSAEAMELERVLAAIVQPAHEGLIKAALATDLLGWKGAELYALSQSETRWQERLLGFREYQQAWAERGFMSMFRRWLVREEVRPRLLAWTDGERRLTNVLHLGEVLHHAALEQHLGQRGLLQWLGQQRVRPTELDEFQLRLERDLKAVRILTLHHSKGLEFDIVFVPFAWRSSELRTNARRPERVLFHRRRAASQATLAPEEPRAEAGWSIAEDLDLPPAEPHRAAAEREKLAENVRLLYVALTRARHRCYFAWGALNHADTSALSWLLHSPGAGSSVEVAALKGRLAERDDDTLRRDLEQLTARSTSGTGPAPIEVLDLPKGTGEIYSAPPAVEGPLQARQLPHDIPRDWRLTSFSALTAGQPVDLPDRDALVGDETADLSGAGMFAFPRGSKPGTCLHEILERIDFSASHTEGERTFVAAKLRGHGISETDFTLPVVEMIQRLRRVPLDPAKPTLTLGAVPPGARRSELEFHFPLKPLSPVVLRRLFTGCAVPAGAAWPARLGRLTFNLVSGFMKGFIDLVFQHGEQFYLIDWKSNWLGNSAEAYRPEALTREMAQRLYVLQYHLYTLALDRYLAHRLPDYDYQRHFGGVFYCFLRALGRSSDGPTSRADSKEEEGSAMALSRADCGIFRDRPGVELIQQLRSTLLDLTE